MSNKKPSKLDVLPGWGAIGSFKERVLRVLAECWAGIYCVICEEGVIKFYDPNGNLLDQCPTGYAKPLATQLKEPTKEQVDAGVCLWRSTDPDDRCLYTLEYDENGECCWFSSDTPANAGN